MYRVARYRLRSPCGIGIVNNYPHTLSVSAAEAMAKGQCLGALFIDVEGAFDYVVPSILIQDLIDIGVPAGIIKFVNFLVSLRCGDFYINGRLLKKIDIIKGVPQGSVLAPLLFNIYIRFLEKHIGGCKNLQFADDCSIYYQSAHAEKIISKLQEGITKLIVWLKSRGLNVAINKTKFILFSKKIYVQYYSMLTAK